MDIVQKLVIMRVQVPPKNENTQIPKTVNPDTPYRNIYESMRAQLFENVTVEDIQKLCGQHLNLSVSTALGTRLYNRIFSAEDNRELNLTKFIKILKETLRICPTLQSGASPPLASPFVSTTTAQPAAEVHLRLAKKQLQDELIKDERRIAGEKRQAEVKRKEQERIAERREAERRGRAERDRLERERQQRLENERLDKQRADKREEEERLRVQREEQARLLAEQEEAKAASEVTRKAHGLTEEEVIELGEQEVEILDGVFKSFASAKHDDNNDVLMTYNDYLVFLTNVGYREGSRAITDTQANELVQSMKKQTSPERGNVAKGMDFNTFAQSLVELSILRNTKLATVVENVKSLRVTGDDSLAQDYERLGRLKELLDNPTINAESKERVQRKIDRQLIRIDRKVRKV